MILTRGKGHVKNQEMLHESNLFFRNLIILPKFSKLVRVGDPIKITI